MGKTMLGKGVLDWHRLERVSNRYGAVSLFGDEGHIPLSDEILSLHGQRGHLEAVVVTPIRSLHIGDLALGVGPSMPEEGEVVILGEDGTLVLTEEDMFGVEPDDERPELWLSVEALYRVHSSLVELWWVTPDE